MVNRIEELLPVVNQRIDSKTYTVFIYAEAYMIQLYNNYYYGSEKYDNPLIKKEKEGEFIFTTNSSNKDDDNILYRHIFRIKGFEFELISLINKIDMLENVD
jgi:Cft2 family RNA processing exonuclease